MSTLYPVQTTVDNGIIVNAPSFGVLSSPEYFIDVANGDDDNDGLSALTAFKTINGLYAALPAVSTNGAKPIVNFVASPSGTAASVTVSGAASGNTRITGLTGMEASDVGGSLQLFHAATAANNVTATIAAVLSPTSVDIVSATGVAGDANNGAIAWNKAHIVKSFYWLGGERQISGVRWRGPSLMAAFPARTGPATAALDVAPVTELSLANAVGVSIPCRTQLNFTVAAPGWTVDDFAGRALARIKDAAGNLKYFECPIARNTATALILDTLLYRTFGIAASIVAGAAAGSMRVSGLVGMTAADVGNTLVVAGAASATNNGAFPIGAFVNATTVDVVNAAAVVPDANNGTLRWWDLPVDRILSTDTVEIVHPAARIANGSDASNQRQIFIGGCASGPTGIAAQNPLFGHAFEKLSFQTDQIMSEAVIDRAFDRCLLATCLLINGQFSFVNCGVRTSSLSLNSQNSPPIATASRPESAAAATMFTATVPVGATSATLVSAAGWPASGKLSVGAERSTFTRVGNVITFVLRGVDGTAAALQTQFTVVYPIVAPLNEAPVVMASAFDTVLTSMNVAPLRPFGSAVWSVHRPFSMWLSNPSATTAALQLAGGGSYMTQSTGAAILGDVVTANRPFMRARFGSQMMLDPHTFFAVGNGTGKTLQLETGPSIDIGAGAGQFMEANGFNGNFYRGQAGSPGAPLGDSSRIGVQLEITTEIDFPAVQTAVFTAKIGRFYRLDPTGAGFVVNLPVAGAHNKGQRIEFKKTTTSVNAITYTPNGAQTVDGAATYVWDQATKQSGALVSDGVSNWEVV